MGSQDQFSEKSNNISQGSGRKTEIILGISNRTRLNRGRELPTKITERNEGAKVKRTTMVLWSIQGDREILMLPIGQKLSGTQSQPT